MPSAGKTFENVESVVHEVPPVASAVAAAVVYLALVQMVFSLSAFTDNTLWLWIPLVSEAFTADASAFLSFDLWLAAALPVSVAVLGGVTVYSLHRDGNLAPGVVAGVYLLAFAASELVFGLEYAMVFVLAAPVAAAAALFLHLAGEPLQSGLESLRS